MVNLSKLSSAKYQRFSFGMSILHFGSCRHCFITRSSVNQYTWFNIKYWSGVKKLPFLLLSLLMRYGHVEVKGEAQPSLLWYEFGGARGSTSQKDISKLYTVNRDSSPFLFRLTVTIMCPQRSALLFVSSSSLLPPPSFPRHCLPCLADWNRTGRPAHSVIIKKSLLLGIQICILKGDPLPLSYTCCLKEKQTITYLYLQRERGIDSVKTQESRLCFASQGCCWSVLPLDYVLMYYIRILLVPIM